MSLNYKDLFSKYGIICNNSVRGGDCRGTTFCLCQLTEKGLRLYYNKTRDSIAIIHEDYDCKRCQITICGCCYTICPNCQEVEYTK